MSGSTETKRTKAIAALLAGETVIGAAIAAGVSERQIYRWMTDETFTGQLRQAERKVLETIGFQLFSLASAAVSGLEEVLTNPDKRGANVRRLAAVSTLELLLKWRESVSFEDRLAQLEARVLDGR